MHNRSATQLRFELSEPGRRAVQLPECDVASEPIAQLLPAEALATVPAPPMPERTAECCGAERNTLQ